MRVESVAPLREDTASIRVIARVKLLSTPREIVSISVRDQLSSPTSSGEDTSPRTWIRYRWFLGSICRVAREGTWNKLEDLFGDWFPRAFHAVLCANETWRRFEKKKAICTIRSTLNWSRYRFICTPLWAENTRNARAFPPPPPPRFDTHTANVFRWNFPCLASINA